MSATDDHLTLAAAHVHDDVDVDDAFPIDPALAFDTEAEVDVDAGAGAGASAGQSPRLQGGVDVGVTQAEIDQATADAIASSLNAAAAQQRQQQEEQQSDHQQLPQQLSHPSQPLQGAHKPLVPSDLDSSAIDGPVDRKRKAEDLDEPSGSITPITNPTIHLAPFSRPERDDDSPHPEHIHFPTKAEFESWFAGEDSWCHFVQRRVTTPEKRSEERAKARIRAHERALAAMTPEEAANTPAPKRRRRAKTSLIVEKVTFTCHHAGSYASRHSDTLPKSKLRLNTKQSVKCGCQARIVSHESQDGDVRVTYFWKHQGHDPFTEGEHDTGRLPKVVDDWIVVQIQAGKAPEEIRKLLHMTEEEKDALLKAAADDANSVTPDMPPPLAANLKIKYPDIYNRYRKHKGPIRESRPSKARRLRASANGESSAAPADSSSFASPLPAEANEGEWKDEAGPSDTAAANASVAADTVDYLTHEVELPEVQEAGVDVSGAEHAVLGTAEDLGVNAQFAGQDGGEAFDASHIVAAAAAAVQSHADAQAQAQAEAQGEDQLIPQSSEQIEGEEQWSSNTAAPAHQAAHVHAEDEGEPDLFTMDEGVEMTEEIARIANELAREGGVGHSAPWSTR
ncbi:hypothetical protein JCM24511_06313 [Saitozyma sp. JCM 24511]|nr:hypothetical protein JCM24511_06313 [Saitozyma sp. JCM 24511]